MAASGSATHILAVAEPAASGTGTYSIQMTECQSCLKNATTIGTMLGVMQQQAQTLKEQQSTIANLITMLSNATGTGFSNMAAKPAESSSKLSQLMKTPATRPKSQPQRSTVTKSPGHNHSSLYSTPTPNQRGKASKVVSRVATPVSKTKKRAVDHDFPLSADEEDSDHNNMESDNNVTATGAEEGGDDDTVTKIWIRGAANEKCPCPLTECANRKFAAADMYYLRRHFQQVHRSTHPNPYFVIQCPVDDCGAEFEQSLREMRKHLSKEHSDLFPSSARKHTQVIIAAAASQADNGSADGEEEVADGAISEE